MTQQELIKFRYRFGLTQAQCAKALSVSVRSMSNWERGVHPVPEWLPDIMTVYALKLPKYNHNLK